MLRLSNAIKRSIERRNEERSSSVFVGLDEVVSLGGGPDGPDPRLRLTGFDQAEADGAWSQARVASVELSLRSKDRAAHVQLQIDYLPLVVDEHVAEIEMIVNSGAVVVLSRYGDLAGWRRATALAVIDPTSEFHAIRCEFRIRNPVSPRELGLGGDDRKLGLKLGQVVLVKADAVKLPGVVGESLDAETIADIQYVSEPVAPSTSRQTYVQISQLPGPDGVPTQSLVVRIARRLLRTRLFAPVQRAVRYARNLSALARTTEANIEILQRDQLRFANEFRERLHLLQADGAAGRSSFESSIRRLSDTARNTLESSEQKIDHLAAITRELSTSQQALLGRLEEFEQAMSDRHAKTVEYSAASQRALSDRVQSFQTATLDGVTRAIDLSSTSQRTLLDRVDALQNQTLAQLTAAIQTSATSQISFSSRVEALERRLEERTGEIQQALQRGEKILAGVEARIVKRQEFDEVARESIRGDVANVRAAVEVVTTSLNSSTRDLEEHLGELQHVNAEALQRVEEIRADVDARIVERQREYEVAWKSIRGDVANVRAAVEVVTSVLVERTEPLLRRLVLPIEGGWLLRTPFGYLSCPHSEKWLAASLLEAGDVELGTRLLIERLLDPGMVFVDVGANIGIHTIPAAKRVGPTGHVFSFEPTPEIVRHLQSTIALNGLSQRVTVLPVAAGACAGEATLYLGTASGLNSIYPLGDTNGESVRVKMVSLDAALGDRKDVELIKIDVEGAELEVLKGATGLLAANPQAAIIAEFGPSHLVRVGIEPKAWFKAFAALQMQCYLIDALKGTCTRITQTRDLYQVHSENLLFVRKGARIHGMVEASHG